MAPRAYWKGSLKLSLVSCPVLLYPASTAVEKTRFHMINRETGNRLKQQMVDAETGDIVEGEQKGRGYELQKGRYVEIEPEELDETASQLSFELAAQVELPAEAKQRLLELDEEQQRLELVIELLDSVREALLAARELSDHARRLRASPRRPGARRGCSQRARCGSRCGNPGARGA